MSKGVEYLVEGSAAAAEANSAALAAAKARIINGDIEQFQDGHDGVETARTGKQNSTLIMPESALLSSIPHVIQLHHRPVCAGNFSILNFLLYFNLSLHCVSEFKILALIPKTCFDANYLICQ